MRTRTPARPKVGPPATNDGAPWANRIIGIVMMAPEDILAHPDNWRIHPEAQQEALADSLDHIGWLGPCAIVNRTTGHCVDGHLRTKLALRRNEAKVPVLVVEASEEQEKLALATMDPIAALAVTDGKKLNELMADLDTHSAALDAMLDELRSKAGSGGGVTGPHDEGPARTRNVCGDPRYCQQARESGVQSLSLIP